MRVTKTIKEYVKRIVNEKYKSQVVAIRKDEQKIIDEIQERFEAILDVANAKASIILAEYPNFINRADYYNGERTDKIFRIHTNLVNTISREKVDNLFIQRDRKIEDILITLELGGNKEILDEMLKNI